MFVFFNIEASLSKILLCFEYFDKISNDMLVPILVVEYNSIQKSTKCKLLLLVHFIADRDIT